MSDHSCTKSDLPPAFACLSALVTKPAAEPKTLSIICETFVDDVEDGIDSVSLEFAPLVWTLLGESNLHTVVSDRARNILQSSAKHAAARSLAREHVMEALGKRMADETLPAVLLKGAAMDGEFYSKDAFRAGFDVDILVRREDYARVDDVFAGLATRVEKTPGKRATTAFAIEKTFVSGQSTSVQLDVHREVSVPHVYAIDYDQWFDRTVPHSGFGGQFRRLCNEDNLLQFAMHSFYDLQLLSKQTIDAYMLLRRSDVDWSILISRARECKALLPVKLMLESVENVFGSIVPESTREELRLSQAKRWMARRLLSGASRSSMHPGVGFRLKQLFSQLLLSGNVSGWGNYYMRYSAAKIGDARH